jgi:hypothetical protein
VLARRGYQELVAMSDLDLEDLGISRTDIDAIFAGKYDRAGPNLPNLIVPDRRDEARSLGEARPAKRNRDNKVEDASLRQSELAAFAKEAHEKICPHSHATRNNIDVQLEVKGA